MVDADLVEFASLLDGVCALLTRGQYAPNEASTELFFNALAGYPMPAVRAAFQAHVKTSRFSPTPADLLDILAKADGRLGPEEAWSEALQSVDESVSVVWTPEMAQAWNVARQVLPDKIGARMAFKEAYAALVEAARARREPMRWEVSLGHDPAKRAEALKRADDLNRGWRQLGLGTTAAEDTLALPAPREPVALLAGPDGASPQPGLTGLLALRARMAEPKPYVPSADALARLQTTAAQRQAADEVAEYATRHGLELPPPEQAIRQFPAEHPKEAA
jgi:hypothetical protein